MSAAPDAEAVAWHESRPTFTQLPDWLLTHPEVSDAALRTWLVLAQFADREGQAFPGVAAVAAKRAKSRRQVFEHLDQLQRAGAIRRHARYRTGGGGRTSTLYVLAWAYPLVSSAQTMGAENRTGGMGAENRTGARAENRTPRTRTKKEPETPNPTSTSSESLEQPETVRGLRPPTPHRSKVDEAITDPRRARPARRSRPERLNPRSLGTNPRAKAQKAAEASKRIEVLRAAQRYGAQVAALEPHLEEHDLDQRLAAEAERDPAHAWDTERLEACLTGFRSERTRLARPAPAEQITGDGPGERGSVLAARIARIAQRSHPDLDEDPAHGAP